MYFCLSPATTVLHCRLAGFLVCLLWLKASTGLARVYNLHTASLSTDIGPVRFRRLCEMALGKQPLTNGTASSFFFSDKQKSMSLLLFICKAFKDEFLVLLSRRWRSG